MDISVYRFLCHDSTIAATKHFRERCLERHIRLDDIEKAISNGRIIEEYPDDTPFPSCLILGPDVAGQPLHVVLSTDNETLYLITTYRPDTNKWESDFATRKESKK